MESSSSASMPPSPPERRRVRRVGLVGRLDVSGVAVGEDFRFGQDRVGNAAYLARRGAELGFETAVLPSLVVGGTRMSSSAIQVRHHGRSGREGGGHARALLVRRRPCRVRPGRAAADCDQSRMHDRYGLYAVRVAAQGQVRDAVATRSPASRTGRPCSPSRCSMGPRISATERSRSNSSPGSEGCALPLGGSSRRAPFTRPYGSDTGVIGRPVRRDHRIRVAVVAAAMIP